MTTLQVNISSPVAVILSIILGLQLHHHFNRQTTTPVMTSSAPVHRTATAGGGCDDVCASSGGHEIVPTPPIYSHSKPASSPPAAGHATYTPSNSLHSPTVEQMPAINKALADNKPPEVNFRPVIGILAQEAIGPYFNFGDFIIFPAHVRWLQMSGANVIPIWANQTFEYYERIVKQLNGLYLPGGHSKPLDSTYGRGAQILLELAIKENENGHYFPVWATCLGLQFLFSNLAGEDATYKCEEMYKQTKFYRGIDYENSFIDQNVPSDQLPALFDENYMPHMHHFCVSMKTYYNTPAMREFFKVVSVNTDDGGTEYISTAQARNYPIYAVQWHPEKFSFHWNMKANTPHTTSAIELGQSLGSFFVSEARRNSHSFDDPHTEEVMLIENFPLTFLGRPSYASFYFFNATTMTSDALNERKALVQRNRKLRFANVKTSKT